jgi:uncharacterized protein
MRSDEEVPYSEEQVAYPIRLGIVTVSMAVSSAIRDPDDPLAWRPTADTERCAALDVIRGVALFGVLLVNLDSDFRVSLPENLLGVPSSPGWANRAAELVLIVLVQFKAFGLFSLLFGAGFAIFGERAATRGSNPTPLLGRRLLVLLALGLCHLLLIWNGDVLVLYAVCGLLLLPFYLLPASALTVLGIAFLALPYVFPWGLGLPSGDVLRQLASDAARVYTIGDAGDVLEFHWYETRLLIVPLLVGVLPRTFGLMLLGAAAWRGGVFRSPDDYRRLLWGIAVAGIGAGATATLLLTFAVPTSLSPALLNASSSVPMSLGYAAALLLALRSPAVARALSPLATVGQMALTNYLLQSVALSLLFYGYGLGLYGQLGSAAAAGCGLALYTAQVVLSSAWLSRYRFGPAEWLWRSLTYHRSQPMRRAMLIR